MDFILEFAEKTSFPAEAAQVFLDLEKRFLQEPSWDNRLKELKESLLWGDLNSTELIKKILKMAEDLSLSSYTLQLYFFIRCAEPLREEYIKKGLPLEIFWDTMADLKYKLMECKEVHQVWGTFVGEWFVDFFRLKRFALGRFQYEKIPFPFDEWEQAGIKIKKGDTVYNIHIPSSGPMTKEMRLDSYRRAYAFYHKEGKVLPVVCNSWLLFEGNREILPPTSNILDFMNDFTILNSQETEEFTAGWRIFGSRYKESIKELPRETSLQRAFADWFLAGKKAGNGFGILLFDGNKII